MRRRLVLLARQTWVIALAAALLATLAAEGLYRSTAAARIEYLYSDMWHRIAGLRESPKHVALVMIDDATLAEHSDEPLVFWTPHFARAIEVLRQAGVKLIALDFIFSGSPERWIDKLGLNKARPGRDGGEDAARNYDQPFRSQINQGRVILSGFRTDATALQPSGAKSGATDVAAEDFVLPSPDYLLALPELDMVRHIGLANLRADVDGTTRRFGMVEATGEVVRKESLPNLGFGALTALRASDQDPKASIWQFGGRRFDVETNVPIAYSGPPGSFASVSFRELLAPDAATNPAIRALADKVVVIGAGFAGMNDLHSTPYSTSLTGVNSLMPGPEIQANIIETLLAGKHLDETPAAIRMAVFVVLFAVLAGLGARVSVWHALVMVAVIGVLAALLAYAAFLARWLFPLAHLQLGMLVVLICLAVLRLVREERERERVGQMFGRYVSPQVVQALLASPELPELGGQARQVTVLFSDIRGFTTLSEKLSAREVVEMLNAYFERACASLLKEGATIDKFIGDAIMAEFGAPLDQPDHARRALRAAVALRCVALEFRAWMAQRFAGRGLHEFDIGIGLHSGEAVVGNIGSSARMEYTAIGDTVNIASRLEGLTKDTACPILASRDTVEAAGAGVVIGARHELKVKGRDQPVAACEILEVGDETT